MSSSAVRKQVKAAATLRDQADTVAQVNAADAPALYAAALAHATNRPRPSERLRQPEPKSLDPLIDIGFDFRTDARGKDPDSHSPTLRRYHRLLWSKPLPSGEFFDLSDTLRGLYLHHGSALGEFSLSSDTVMQTFTRWPALKPITEQFSASENAAFMRIAYTIGAMMVFPGIQIDRKWTINQARGCNKSISDRFDLTLECNRRHYSGQGSPLSGVLSRYGDFFALFDDFRGYVSFFLLDDLVNDDLSVKFFMPFDDFNPPPVPKDVGTYREYRRRSIEFIEARNHRIKLLDL